MLSSSLLDLLQSLLMLPLTLMAYVGWVLEKTLSCNTSTDLLTVLALLGLPLGVFYDGWMRLGVVVGATTEMVIVTLLCALPNQALLELSMLAVSPEVLLASIRPLY